MTQILNTMLSTQDFNSSDNINRPLFDESTHRLLITHGFSTQEIKIDHCDPHLTLSQLQALVSECLFQNEPDKPRVPPGLLMFLDVETGEDIFENRFVENSASFVLPSRYLIRSTDSSSNRRTDTISPRSSYTNSTSLSSRVGGVRVFPLDVLSLPSHEQMNNKSSIINSLPVPTYSGTSGTIENTKALKSANLLMPPQTGTNCNGKRVSFASVDSRDTQVTDTEIDDNPNGCESYSDKANITLESSEFTFSNDTTDICNSNAIISSINSAATASTCAHDPRLFEARVIVRTVPELSDPGLVGSANSAPKVFGSSVDSKYAGLKYESSSSSSSNGSDAEGPPSLNNTAVIGNDINHTSSSGIPTKKLGVIFNSLVHRVRKTKAINTDKSEKIFFGKKTSNWLDCSNGVKCNSELWQCFLQNKSGSMVNAVDFSRRAIILGTADLPYLIFCFRIVY